jgi:ribonuclease P protein component
MSPEGRCARHESALSFPKGARLLRRAEFLAVGDAGGRFADGPLAASFRARDPAAPGMPRCLARVGITVSSKVGGAVVRNRVKRRIREAVRHELASLPAVDLVLVARASAASATVEDFRRWLGRAAQRIAAEVGAS